MPLYELVIIGTANDPRIPIIRREVEGLLEAFDLKLGDQVNWVLTSSPIPVSTIIPVAILYLGGTSLTPAQAQVLIDWRVPILPVVSSLANASSELPNELACLNAVAFDPSLSEKAGDVAMALLECIGLLPKQRRVFVSYRRTEATEVAHQLFAQLSARGYEVFLDTHRISPGVEFQNHLWHKLCESDVLIMLDTPGYFVSRWTSQEFGFAQAKGFAILRVGWPGFTPSDQIATTYQVNLEPVELDSVTKHLLPGALDRICVQLEFARSKSIAVRTKNLIGHVQRGLLATRGELTHVGPYQALHVRFQNGNEAVAYAAVGVPTSITLHDAANRAAAMKATKVAVVYDRASILAKWVDHLDWLGTHVQSVRWIQAHEFSTSVLDWGA